MTGATSRPHCAPCPSHNGKGVDLVPSAFLDVAMGENQALVTFSPTPQD